MVFVTEFCSDVAQFTVVYSTERGGGLSSGWSLLKRRWSFIGMVLKRSGLSSGLPIPQDRDTTPLLNCSTNNLVLLSFCGRKGEHWLCSCLLSFSHGRLPRWKKGRTESTSPGSYYDYTFSHHYLFLQSTMSLQQRKMQHFSVQWRKYNCRSLEAEVMSIYNNNLISAPQS